MIKKLFCKKCKKELCKTAIYNHNKLCRKCYYKSLRGKGNPMFGFKFGDKQKKMWSKQRSGKHNSMFGIKGIQAPNYKHGKFCKIYNCIDCGIKLGRGISFRCKSCSKKGKLNPAYINGQKLKPYPKEYNNKLRIKILKRDNNKCKLCKNTKKLHIHHIDYNKHNNKSKNLLTLCSKCHKRTNWNRTYWTNYLKKRFAI